jgi:predicted DCC family thiol-disulfide oxidoreductase YuxK
MNRPPAKLTLFFDQQCPFCALEMKWLKKIDRHHKIQLIDISSTDFIASSWGLSQNELEANMHAIDTQDKVITKMEVFRRVYSEVGLGWLFALTGFPGIKWIFDLGYRIFAKHRIQLGQCTKKICRIQ